MNYAEIFRALIPETIVVVTALIVLGVDLITLHDASNQTRGRVGALLLGLGCAGAIAALAQTPSLRLLDGMLVLDRTALYLKQIVLVLTIITAVISLGSNFTKHIGEYLALLLLATVGMMLLVSSDNLLLIFVALELTSLPLYALTAFNKSNVKSSEAALKYFLFGSMAAAFMLFGLSLIYGISGEITLGGVAAKLGGRLEPVFYVALVMTAIGFAFKIAAAPFHLWAPDVYQGAPTPVAAFIASGSKVASFFVLARIMMIGLAGAEGSAAWREGAPGWVSLLAMLAIISMVLGNIAAIAQSSVKRLLAYSAIAHAGYALLAVVSNSAQGFNALLYYVVTYAVTALGAFAVVSVVENSTGENLHDFAGLSRRSPVLSLCMLVFVLSLAGIPPLAGFFGKFYVFTAATRSGGLPGLLWLVIIAIATSAVSLYYYLQILKQIYVMNGTEGTTATLKVSLPVQVSILLLAAAVIFLGCAPDWLLQKFALAPAGAGF